MHVPSIESWEKEIYRREKYIFFYNIEERNNVIGDIVYYILAWEKLKYY